MSEILRARSPDHVMAVAASREHRRYSILLLVDLMPVALLKYERLDNHDMKTFHMADMKTFHMADVMAANMYHNAWPQQRARKNLLMSEPYVQDRLTKIFEKARLQKKNVRMVLLDDPELMHVKMNEPFRLTEADGGAEPARFDIQRILRALADGRIVRVLSNRVPVMQLEPKRGYCRAVRLHATLWLGVMPDVSKMNYLLTSIPPLLAYLRRKAYEERVNLSIEIEEPAERADEAFFESEQPNYFKPETWEEVGQARISNIWDKVMRLPEDVAAWIVVDGVPRYRLQHQPERDDWRSGMVGPEGIIIGKVGPGGWARDSTFFSADVDFGHFQNHMKWILDPLRAAHVNVRLKLTKIPPVPELSVEDLY